MSELETVLHKLIGQGVCFTVEHESFLRVVSKTSGLDPATIGVIKQHKPFLLSILPNGQTVTTRQLQDAIEHYKEREALMLGNQVPQDQATSYAAQSACKLLVSFHSSPLPPS